MTKVDPTRPMWLFATVWSLRKYPSPGREWSWKRKFAAIRDSGFDGVFAAPAPEIAERGDLRYFAGTSIDAREKTAPLLEFAKKLGAVAIDVQLGDYDTPVVEAVKLAMHVRDVARSLDLPFAIETHRDTFTETPESTLALTRGYYAATGEILPLCLDHSHFAVIRHFAPGTFWARLREPAELLEAATQFHLRPFNGHHCQIPVLDARGRRTPEYRDWLDYSAALLEFVRRQKTTAPALVVPELGNAAPAYRLSCFGATLGATPRRWRETCGRSGGRRHRARRKTMSSIGLLYSGDVRMLQG